MTSRAASFFQAVGHIKGNVAWDFWACFLACMDVPGPNMNRLWFLKFTDAPLILDN
jgi:hypothetical protein